MLFNSIEFLLFFPIVTFLYFALPFRYRWFLLLAASCIFYMAFVPIYILILAITILIDYFAAIYIDRSEGKRKKLYLILSIISTCLVLFIFKYFNFFITNINDIAAFLGLKYPFHILHIILPIGLSFHTFQSLSYVIEVYRGHQKPEYHFGIYSLYVMFYPQLVAGPIERPQNLLHQFHQEHRFNYTDVSQGLKRVAWGMFKKIVIADRLAIAVNYVYNNPGEQTSLAIILATIFFAFQIYCDFSGYSDIAIGAARVMGIRLMNNFDRPYFSSTVAEFWTRWHISLSSWLRDYLFLPLAYFFSRKLKKESYFRLDSNQIIYALATMITFTLCGLWHGAAWTYVVWGILNGIYLVTGNILKKPKNRFFKRIGLKKFPGLIYAQGLLVTFGLICFSWIFFRARTFEEVGTLLSGLFTRWDFSGDYFQKSLFLGLDAKGLIIVILAIIILLIFDIMQTRKPIQVTIQKQPPLVRWAVYFLFINVIFILGIFGGTEFIYFQF